MAFMSIMLIFAGFFLIVLFGGGALQVCLSLCRNKLPGLILPVIIFLLSMGPLVNMIGSGSVEMNATTILALIWSIPIVIDLIIYFVCRAWLKRKEKRSEQNRMSAQNLE